MQKQKRKPTVKRKEDISGSETIAEKIKKKTPWIMGSALRKPKIAFPKLKQRKLTLPMPSKSLSVILIYAILFVLQTGVVYLIYREPPAIGATSGGEPLVIYPDVQESFIIEGIVASILIFLSSLGYILLYQASKYVYNRSIAQRILVFGVILILSTFVALQYMLAVKTNEIREFFSTILNVYG